MSLPHVLESISAHPRVWAVTGAAGFIGSHLIEQLLLAGQKVRAIDNFITGSRENLREVESKVGNHWAHLTFIEGSITDPVACATLCEGAEIVLHQAALGSVPRSIDNPLASNEANVTGFLTMAWAAKLAGVKRFVYASSSSVYGDDQSEVKHEAVTGTLLSPYAVTKKVNELYAQVCSALYPIEMVGLRYFNVFGPRQDPNGPYAAVIPRWIARLVSHEPCQINGDGLTSRDFSYVLNVVQANLLAGSHSDGAALQGSVYNVGCGSTTSLTELYWMIANAVQEQRAQKEPAESQPLDPLYEPFRTGDIRHSLASIERTQGTLGYAPTHSVDEGLRLTVQWFFDRSPKS